MKFSVSTCLVAILARSMVLGFAPHTTRFVVMNKQPQVLFSIEQEDDIETAERDLFEAEQAKRKDDAQLGFNEMEKGQYNAKKNDYDAMRARLRNRAGSMEMKQSMETEEVSHD